MRVGRSAGAGGGSDRPQGFQPSCGIRRPASSARPRASTTTPIASPARPTARAWWSSTTRIPSSSAPTRSIWRSCWPRTRWPLPRTVILSKDNLLAAEEAIGYPVVLKIPDGSFSRGVFKAENRTPSWRRRQAPVQGVGSDPGPGVCLHRVRLAGGHPQQAAHVRLPVPHVRKHWQIVNHQAKGNPRQGGFRPWPWRMRRPGW
jgi:hypothetical protein